MKLIEWELPGNIVPPVTPFDAAGTVDYRALQAEIDYVVAAARPAAICVAGVEAQEYQYLSEVERRELIRETIAAIGGRVPALVGVSHASFRRSIELAHYAADLGASAVQLLIPNRPSGGKPTTSEVVAYFTAIARESPLPVVAYHNQGPGADLGLAALLEVLAIDRVIGHKESSRNQRFLGTLINEANRRGSAHIFTTMEVLFPTLLLGAAGGTMPAPGAAISALLVDAFRAGDLARAAEFHALHSEMPARWVDHGLVAVMKVSLRALGLACGDTYPPFGPVPAAHVAEIEAFWADALARYPALRYEAATAIVS
jgi:4-hydroxy-tetrahydrodipicolinate synthase